MLFDRIRSSLLPVALIACATLGSGAFASSMESVLHWLREDSRFLNTTYVAARQDALNWKQQDFRDRLKGWTAWYGSADDPGPQVVIEAIEMRREFPELTAAFDDALQQFQSQVLAGDIIAKSQNISPQHLSTLPNAAQLSDAVNSLSDCAADTGAQELASFALDPLFAEHFDVLAFEAILTSWGHPETRVALAEALAAQPRHSPQRLKRLWAVAHSGQPEVVREASERALWQGIKDLQSDGLTDAALDELFWIYKADRERDCASFDPAMDILEAFSRAESKRALEHAEELVRLEREIYMPQCGFSPWEKPLDELRAEMKAVAAEMSSKGLEAARAGKIPLLSKEVITLKQRYREMNERLIPTAVWTMANNVVDQMGERHGVAVAPDEETPVVENQER